MKLDTLEESFKQLPSDFFQQHKDLRELSLISCSNLNKLLPQIGQLQSLQKLTISGGDLKGLPPEIGQLQNLQKLILDKYKFTELPPEIGQLKNLKLLAIKGSKIQYCPLRLDN